MATADSGTALAPDQLIGNYRVVGILGQGGMGQVYSAVHDEIGRRVAIKVLHPEVSANPDLARRFLNEARAVNRVGHSGLVEIFDFGRLPDSRTYIVMEFLEGETLAGRLSRERTLPEVDALRLVRGVAQALMATHAVEIVHRDLKPENIMIVPDKEHGGERTKVLDFGIAKVREGGTPKTRTSAIMGTAVYMAPEQCRGSGLLDAKADVYALGVILYELLAGEPPFQAEEEVEIMAMHLRVEPPSLKDAAPHVSGQVADLVGRMLRKVSSERPTMVEVAQAIAQNGTSGSWPAVVPSEGAPALLSVPRPELKTPAELHDPEAVAQPDRGGPSPSTRLRPGRVVAGGLLGVGIVGGLWVALHTQAQPGMPERTGVWPQTQPQDDMRPLSDLRLAEDQRSATVHWSIESNTAGAEVREADAGRLLGLTPLALDLPRKAGTLKVKIQKAGYFSKTLTLDQSKDQVPQQVMLVSTGK